MNIYKIEFNEKFLLLSHLKVLRKDLLKHIF